MRKIFAVLLVALCLVGVGQAQEGPLFFSGLEYDNEYGVGGLVGYGTHLGSGLWSLTHVTIGNYAQVNTNLAYLISPKEHMIIGVVAGPNADWQGSEDPTVYITTGSGFIAAYEWEIFGLFGAGRYNFKLDPDNQTYYQTGWSLNAGVTMNFGP